MLKRVVFMLLCVVLALFYGRGYILPDDFGANTLSMTSHYFIKWMEMFIIYLIIPKEWGIAFKTLVLFICFMFAIQVIVHYDLRSRGIIPDNNEFSIYSCVIGVIATTVIYFFEKKINAGSD